jgi:hypothetical protein
MRNRATAPWVALALMGVGLPSVATAQEAPAAEMPDSSGWTLANATRNGEPARELDPLAPTGQGEAASGKSEASLQPIEMAEASRPRMPGDEKTAAGDSPSQAAALVTNWVIASGDNGGLPFMVIDKVAASVFLFDAQGQLIGATPALLGITAGDESAPGVGDRELSDIKPEDRTTPAGRFVAKFGRASGNRNVLWVDYATSISLHPVVTTNKKERRPERLRSPSPEDNRITFGCINVPAQFYQEVVRPLFKNSTGIVYILPETKYLFEVFPAFRPDLQPASHAEASP